jgi:hypothetical protein
MVAGGPSTGGRSTGEALYSLPPDLPLLEAVRGSILFFDWTWLRQHGRYEAYAAEVEPRFRERLLGAATGDWIPVDAMRSHYQALDAIALTYEEAFDVGHLVAERGHGALLSTIVRLAGTFGATPWLALNQAHKMWERAWRGGGIAVYRINDRAARLESRANPFAPSPFHRASFSGAVDQGLEALCRERRVTELSRARTPTSFTLTIEWA